MYTKREKNIIMHVNSPNIKAIYSEDILNKGNVSFSRI